MRKITVEQEVLNNLEFFKKMAYRYVKNEQDAMDLVQETMFKVLSKITQFKKGTNLKAWISVIMRNVFINQYRKRKRMTVVDFEDKAVGGIEEANGDYNLFNQEVMSAIKNLGARDQELIHMCKEGYSYKEMADHLNLPLGTIKSRIHHARKMLRREINKMNQLSWIR
jgi:RNA polymerase sigma-70 factor (ECF subfamily)